LRRWDPNLGVDPSVVAALAILLSASALCLLTALCDR
jgi:hypothetical protein